MSKTFPLSTILTVALDKFVARDGLDSVRALLSYMTNDEVYTHQIPHFMDECGAWIFRQHPQLKAITKPTFTDHENVYVWLSEQERQFGLLLDIEPIPADDHAERDPVRELEQLANGKPIITMEI